MVFHTPLFIFNLIITCNDLFASVKKSGNIGKIISYIEWDKIEALGLSGFAMKSEKTAYLLSDKEVF